MESSTQLANRLREVVLNGKWIANTNFKDQLDQTDWTTANQKVGTLNTIAALTFHVNYYLGGILEAFESGALSIKDKYSFDMPAIESQADWEKLVETLMDNAEKLAQAIESMSGEQLEAPFFDERYGTYRRNMEAMIEHCYYHLGQILLLRKLIAEKA